MTRPTSRLCRLVPVDSHCWSSLTLRWPVLPLSESGWKREGLPGSGQGEGGWQRCSHCGRIPGVLPGSKPHPGGGKGVRNTPRHGTSRGGGRPLAFQPVLLLGGPSKPLVLRKKEFHGGLSTWNTKSQSLQEVGQECSVVKNGKRKLSSAGRKAPPFLWGQKKIKRSDGDAWLSRATPSSTSPGLDHPGHRTSRQPGLPQEQASEGAGRYKVCTSSGALRSTAPPNDHPDTPRGRGRGKRRVTSLDSHLELSLSGFLLTFQTWNRASFQQLAGLLKKNGSKAKEETRVWKKRKRQGQRRMSPLGGFPEVS